MLCIRVADSSGALLAPAGFILTPNVILLLSETTFVVSQTPTRHSPHALNAIAYATHDHSPNLNPGANHSPNQPYILHIQEGTLS